MDSRVAALLVLSFFYTASANADRTNVVIVLVDNQGYFELGCKGNPFISTPNIDRFARNGVDFCNFHAENFCSPSRAALLTGKQPMRLGVHNTIGGVSLLDPAEVTLADRLKKAGYRTGVFGKWHLGVSHPFHPSLRGFDEVFVHGGGGIGQLEDYAGNHHMDAHFQHNGQWVKSSGFSTDVLFDRAIEFIESSGDQPFFCYLPTPAVHFPVQAEPKALARIKDRGVTEEQTNLARASMIENLDDNLGRLLKHLDKLGIRENTFVVFMTDQGVGDRGVTKPFWPGKDRQKDLGNASEGKHRVFCMMQKPGMTVAGENLAIACIRDLCPTILDVCGLNVPGGFDGRSLVPLMKGAKEWQDDRIIVMQCPRGRGRAKWKHAAVKQDHWRLVSGGRLYDVSSDSLMEKDLAAQHPELVDRLNAAYEEFWNSLPPEDYIVQRHVLGSREARSTLLCAMDWREGGAPWNSGALRDGYRGQGSWYVTVERAGRYRITLCRTMKETPLPLGAIHGEVTVGPFSAASKLSADDTQCVVELDLKPGDYPLQSVLRSSKAKDKTWGANFAYVDIIKPAPKERPKVLIIGDSISLGYTPILTGMLHKQVDIVRPLNPNGGWLNCEGTKRGVEQIDEWLAEGDFDVIHFNFGLHDLKHVDPQTGRNSNNPNHPQQSDLRQYEKNLRAIVAKLRATDAELIFATTTPYPDKPGGPLRRADQPARYNEIAVRVMKENGIRLNDLHAFVRPRMKKLLLPNNVHFRPSANVELAELVANEIKAALRKPAQ